MNVKEIKDKKISIIITRGGVSESLLYGEDYTIKNNQVVILNSVLLDVFSVTPKSISK